METTRQIREHNLIEIIRTLPAITASDATTLQRISHRLRQLDEASCNWGLTERQEKREERLEKQAQDIADKYNRFAYHQGDPRGWSLYLLTAEEAKSGNYYNGLGICPH